MELKGVIVEESLKDKSVLKDIKIIKKQTEAVTSKHRTPWLSKWTLLTIEFPEEKIDEICEKLQKCLDNEHEWYIDLKSKKYDITIFNDRIIKKRVFNFG